MLVDRFAMIHSLRRLSLNVRAVNWWLRYRYMNPFSGRLVFVGRAWPHFLYVRHQTDGFARHCVHIDGLHIWWSL